MQEEYPFKEIESNVQGFWDINQIILHQQKFQIKRSIMFYPCFLTQVASFIWVMSEIIQLGM